jgi:ubiquitin-protein ligase E3 C
MVPTFTGTSRRPRQVNLSGRTSNPFAAANPSARTTQQPSGLRSTVESARQERLQREQDRTRHQAAKQIQRVWRGHLSREKPKTAWRSEWDAREQEDGLEKPAYGLQGQQTRSEELIQGYKSGDICLQQLRMLLRFASPTSKDDDRIDRFSTRLIATIQEHPELLADPGYTYSLNRFRLLSTKYTRRAINHGPRILSWINMELELLSMLAQATQRDTALQSGQYYGLLSIITTKLAHRQDAQENISYQSLLATAILTPLRSIHSETLAAYEGFATTYMTTKNLNDQFNILDILGGNINYKLLARALAISLRAPSSVILQEAASKRLWLLSYFIYFHHPTGNPGTASKHIPELDYVLVISILLTSLADDIKRRIGIEPSSIENMGEPDTLSSSTPRASPQPLPTFVRQQISSLVDQKRISNLLTHMSISQGNDSIAEDESEEARALASYALTLLRVFSEKGYEIRMWLYLGSTTGSTSKTPSRERLPAIKYFWNAAKRTEVFKAISKDSKAAIDLLRRDNINEGNSLTSRRRDQEWRIILLFFELYAFVLKVADDDEFFSSASKMNKRNSSQTVSWARESALPLPEVRDLSIFLKNLAFTLYWNSSDILGTQEEISTGSLSQWFSTSKSSLFVSGSDAKDKTKPAEISIAGVNGMTLDHVKGTVTGLLRMIYERE